MVRFFLGVDGGQSSTTAVVGDSDGNVLGEGTAGPCNHVSGAEAVAKFLRVIGGCVADACGSAGLDVEAINFAGACFGFSGGPEDKEVLTRKIVRSEQYKFTHDGEIALSGAFAGGPGIIVIAGTGSLVFGRNAHGETARAGGWGYVFGDEGSAFDLVRRALRSALRMEEGWGEDTVLHRTLLQAGHAANVNCLLHQFYAPQWERSRIAALAPLVTSAADSGDQVALEVLRQCAAALVDYVAGVHRNLFATATTCVAPIGGPFRSAAFRNELAREIMARTGCEVIKPRMSPARGALIEATKLG